MEDKAPQLGAALAYYAVFSIPPLLVIVISLIGLALGAEAAQRGIEGQVSGLMGPEAADSVKEMMARAAKPSRGIAATAMGS